MSRLLSSSQIIKTLLKFGFQLVSQRGSHQKYQKEGFTVIVPSPGKEIQLEPFVQLCANQVLLSMISLRKHDNCSNLTQ